MHSHHGQAPLARGTKTAGNYCNTLLTPLLADDLLLSLERKHHLTLGIALGLHTQRFPGGRSAGLAIFGAGDCFVPGSCACHHAAGSGAQQSA